MAISFPGGVCQYTGRWILTEEGCSSAGFADSRRKCHTESRDADADRARGKDAFPVSLRHAKTHRYECMRILLVEDDIETAD
jgi:hypothetical protein